MTQPDTTGHNTWGPAQYHLPKSNNCGRLMSVMGLPSKTNSLSIRMCRVHRRTTSDDESIWAYICIYAYINIYILIRTCVWIHCIWIYTWCQWIVMYLCSTKSRSLEIHKVVRAEVNSRSSSPGVYQFNDDQVCSLPDDPRSVPSRMGRDHRWSTDPQWLFSWDPWLYKQQINK